MHISYLHIAHALKIIVGAVLPIFMTERTEQMEEEMGRHLQEMERTLGGGEGQTPGGAGRQQGDEAET